MLFAYRALKDNKAVRGKVEGRDEADVVSYLRANDYFPIEVRQTIEGMSIFNALFNSVTFNDVVDLTRQLAIMLNAGLTLIDCLEIIKKQTTKPTLTAIIDDMDKEVRGGKTFSSVLKKYPKLFPNLYISLVKSGEASGKLSDILLKLAENLEKEREFKGKIKGALIYPIIVIIGMLGVMFVMVTFVIPRLLDLYKDFNIELPFATKILITISNFSTQFWPLMIGGIILTWVGATRYMKTSQGKLQFDSLVLKLPIFSSIIKMSVLVDSTRTLSILIGSGISILDALKIIIETTGNLVYQNAFKSMYVQVEKGVSVGQAMTNERVFPPILIQMATVGEQTGHLDETLGRISHYFEMESELAIKTLTTLIEPTILVVLGLGVGFLVTAVITPIYTLTSSFK